MTNTDTANSTTDKAKRAKQASHEYINDAGEKVAVEQATGYRYTSESGFVHEDFPAGKGTNLVGTKVLMLSLFGDKTLHINTASGARQNDENELESINERWAQLDAGQWRERAEGAARGPKYDKDILAVCIVEQLGAAAKGDAAYYRKKLGTADDTEAEAKEARAYYAKVRSKPKIMAAYYNAVGTQSDESDLA